MTIVRIMTILEYDCPWCNYANSGPASELRREVVKHFDLDHVDQHPIHISELRALMRPVIRVRPITSEWIPHPSREMRRRWKP